MEIHELNTFSGTPGNNNYLAIDDGTDTGKISGTNLLAPVNTRIDNIISGVTVDSEVIDARLGADGITYGSLGTAIRTQVTDLKSEINAITPLTRYMWTMKNTISGSGVDGASNYYATTDFTPITPSDRLLYTGAVRDSGNKTLVVYIHYYTSAKVWISRQSVGYNESHIAVIPSNAAYYRIAFGRATSSGVQISETDITSYFETEHYQELTTSGEFEATLIALHNGLIGKWQITQTITAYLFKDGHFSVIGYGKAPTYTSENMPPWGTREILSQVKSIYLDERITFSAMGYWFDDGTVDGFPCGECKEIELNGTATSVRGRSFCALRVNHINYAKYANSSTEIDAIFFPNNTVHTVFSIPNSICTQTFISNLSAEIAAMTGDRVPNAVGLFITDSADLRDAIFASVDSASVSGAVAHNISCLYCDELGADGFPTYWTSQMKDVFREIIPYIGYNRNARGSTVGGEPTFYTKGLTGLSAYRSVGFPSVYDNDSSYNVFAVVDGELTQIKTIQGNSGIGGHPYDNSLNALTNGLTCSGFVEWLYWRYFAENFSLANVDGFYNNTTWYGGEQPLEEITAFDLKPFDILCYAKYEDGEYIGGHMGIYLGQDTYTGRPLIINHEEGGLVFSIWASVFDEGTKYLRMKKSYDSVSAGKLRQE